MTPDPIVVAARSDPGLHRSANEDSYLASFPVFLVADGMGGHDAGDRASAAVIDAFRPLAGRADVVPAEVSDAITAAHRAVGRIAEGTARGAGSTLTGVVHILHEGRPFWLVLNIGDSRVYRQFGNVFERMTIDHSLMQEQLDAGLLAPEDVPFYAHRNVITRAVGAPGSPADFWVRPVTPGERLLLCSDGLCGEVEEQQLYLTLAEATDAATKADSLINQAISAGGHDNITAIVIEVAPESAAVDAGDAASPEAGSAAARIDADVEDADAETTATAQSGRRHG